MRSQVLLLALAGLTLAHTGWKPNTQYVYQLSGRTLTNFENQYSGIQIRANLHLSTRSESKVQAWIVNPQYAQIHTQLNDLHQIDDSQLNYQPMPLSTKPFEIVMDNHLVKSIIVESTVEDWEINVIKSIVNQLNVNLKMEGSFKTMEESIEGLAETAYEVHRVPEYLLINRPWMVPQHLKGDVFEVVKSRNLTENCRVFHYGLSSAPCSNRVGDFMTKHSSSRLVLSGSISKFTIQSSVTVNKVLLTPTKRNQGSAISSMNLTLSSIRSEQEQLRDLINPIEITSLVYYTKPEKDDLSQPLYQPYFGTFDRDAAKSNILTLIKGIIQQINNPQEILEKSTLSQYSMLVAFIRLMTFDELKSIDQQQESHQWVFRDAVADAGTGPALLMIEKWIHTNQIENPEDVIATMTKTVRIPTDRYMEKLFGLVIKTNGILPFTQLVNKVYINRQTLKYQYPINMFESITKQTEDFVTTQVIPYLAQQLKQAINESNSLEIYTIIRALGNVGHKDILTVFNNEIDNVTQYQRTLMVLAMDKLIYNSQEDVRQVLYSIYQNREESWQIRAVAVYQLIRTNPPMEILQQLAENTNTDTDEELNAVVKSAIESACNLVGDESASLRKSARAARPLLTNKKYNPIQSHNLLQNFMIGGINQEVKYNGMFVRDNTGLSGGKFTLRSLRQYLINFQWMVSDLKTLNDPLEKFDDNNPWIMSKITKKILAMDKEEFEAMVYAEIGNFQKLWTFQNNTIKRLWEVSPTSVKYNKLTNLNELQLSFPSAVGFPIMYNSELPTLIKCQIDPKILFDDVLVQGKLLISSKLKKTLFFVTPFDHQVYIAGNDVNFQLNLPIAVKLTISSLMQIELTLPKQESSSLIHFSSWQYTSKVDGAAPMAPTDSTYRIKNTDAHSRLAFMTWGFRGSGHMPMWNMMKSLGNHKTETVYKLWEDATNEHTVINIYPMRTNKYIIGWQYGSKLIREHDIELNRSALSMVKPRINHLMKYVGRGMNDTLSKVVDITLDINNSFNCSLSLAHGSDKISSRVIALITSDSTCKHIFELSMPNQKQWSATLDINGTDGQTVSALINFSRTQKRVDYLQQHPMKKSCDNNHMKSCRLMEIESNQMNKMEVVLSLDRIPIFVKRDNDIPTIIVEFEPDFQKADWTMIGLGQHFMFRDISVDPQMARFLLNPGYGYMTRQDIEPTCVIGESTAETFNNRSYPLHLGAEWSLMMQYGNIAVYVREDIKKNVKIVANNPSLVEIDLNTTELVTTLYVNHAQVDVTDSLSLLDGFVVVYKQDRVYKLVFDEFFLVFDGETLSITATSSNLYNSVYGLCGRFSLDVNEDLTTSSGCIAQSISQFVESYQLNQMPVERNCIKKTVRSTKFNIKTLKENDGTFRIRYVKKNNQICFTTQPQRVCEHVQRSIKKMIAVHCFESIETSKYWMDVIDAGANPDFSGKSVTKTLEFDVAQECY